MKSNDFLMDEFKNFAIEIIEIRGGTLMYQHTTNSSTTSEDTCSGGSGAADDCDSDADSDTIPPCG